MNQELNLKYRMFGNGHPVVFLHGFLESLSMWDQLGLEKLPFTSILIDLPGHGKSVLTDDAAVPSLNFMAKEIMALLDSLKIEKFHVVGHSMGGYVALLLKEHDPRCRKVVLLNSNFWEDSEQKKRDRIRVADIAFKSKDLFINEAIPGLFYRHDRKDPLVVSLIEEAKEIDGAGIAYASLAMRNRLNKKDLVFANEADFLIVQGAHDPLIPKDVMEQKLEGKEVKLALLQHSGHMAHSEEPEKLIAVLTDFLT